MGYVAREVGPDEDAETYWTERDGDEQRALLGIYAEEANQPSTQERALAERADPETQAAWEARPYDPEAAAAEERWYEQHGDDQAPPAIFGMQFYDLAELAAEVDAAGEPRWLLRGIFPAGDHAVLGAPDKAGKTWFCGDLAISVASGTKWLGIYEVETPGPVLLFVGEGGKRKIVRRMRAIATVRGQRIEDLPHCIRVCPRVPTLTNTQAMEIVKDEIARLRPVLVIIDPLYLAAKKAEGSNIYAMGEHLEEAQLVTQSYDSSLLVAHHWNQSGTGTGPERFTGAGPSAWGRVLISAAPVGKTYVEDLTMKTTVTLNVAFNGDEIPDTTISICRQVWADDPMKLSSPLHYVVNQVDRLPDEDDHKEQGERPRRRSRTPAQRKVLAVLSEDFIPRTVAVIGDDVKERFGTPLRGKTIRAALKVLHEEGQVDGENLGSGRTGLWWAVDDF
jgi:hypothetical protein